MPAEAHYRHRRNKTGGSERTARGETVMNITTRRAFISTVRYLDDLPQDGEILPAINEISHGVLQAGPPDCLQ
jgi:hypothetical protein